MPKLPERSRRADDDFDGNSSSLGLRLGPASGIPQERLPTWSEIGRGITRCEPLAILHLGRVINIELGPLGRTPSSSERAGRIVEIMTDLAAAHRDGKIPAEMPADVIVRAAAPAGSGLRRTPA
ncbi:MAG: hypothetical protein IPK00_10240 [Deltaproteobacteria bacterium]|nr:hypothetical protein [Deltaproteobacteria bacterium]